MSWQNDQVSLTETQKILELAYSTLHVPGDWVEFGCYAGDTSLLLADLLKQATLEKIANYQPTKNLATKKLWLYDSFAGLPLKTNQDNSILGTDFQPGALTTSKRELKSRFLRANLPLPIIKKAWFSDLTPADLPETISFAFLDGDFYDSIKTSLKLLANRLNQDSIIVIHDYHNPALPGVKTAVQELLSKDPTQVFETMAIFVGLTNFL